MNTHPNTPFGKFFAKCGVWHPSVEDTLKALYDKLKEDEQIAIKTSSGWIAIVNTYLQDTPEDIFKMIQLKFPDVTKESVTDALNKLNAQILHIKDTTPDTYEDAMEILQTYLSKFQGNTWIAITRAVVTVLSDVLLNGASPIQTIETVLEYVYQTFVKPHVNA
jgi:hypothetical protein